MARTWTLTSPNSWSLEWGGRSWSFEGDGLAGSPGFRVQGASSTLGPLLSVAGLAVRGKSDFGALTTLIDARINLKRDRVEARFTPTGWLGLTVVAAWEPSGDDAVDLSVEVTLAADAGSALPDFELLVASVLPEPVGSRTRRWVEPRDASAAALSYDGREADVRDLTTLPPTESGRLAPRVMPSPWDDGLSYVEVVRTGEVARRVAESRKVSSVGLTTRYGLFGRELPPGGVFRARARGIWLLSADPQSEAIDRAEAFESEA